MAKHREYSPLFLIWITGHSKGTLSRTTDRYKQGQAYTWEREGFQASSWCAETVTKTQWYLDSVAASKPASSVGSQHFHMLSILRAAKGQGEGAKRVCPMSPAALHPKKGARFEAGAEALGWYIRFWSAAWDRLAPVPRSHTAATRAAEMAGGQALAALPKPP